MACICTKPTLDGADLTEANLQDAKLEHTNLRNVRLGLCNLRGVDLRNADLREVDFLDVGARGLQSAKLYRAKLDHTLLKREQLGLAIGDELAGEYQEAQYAYLNLKRNFADLGDYEAASWAYIKERQMEKKCHEPRNARHFHGRRDLGDSFGDKLSCYHPRVLWFYARHTAAWLLDWFVELICGYGERPWRTVAAMIAVFVVFSGLYGITWSVMRSAPDNSTFIPTRDPRDLAIFSLAAFTTMDAKGLEPRAGWVQIATGIEALLGIGLTGLLGFVIGNRIRRS